MRIQNMICKIFSIEEYEFYTEFNSSSELNCYIPKFFGVLSLKTSEIKDSIENVKTSEGSPWGQKCFDKFLKQNNEGKDVYNFLF
jgi:hypothetical protein